MDSLITLIKILSIVASLRSANDTAKPMDYLIGGEIKAQYKLNLKIIDIENLGKLYTALPIEVYYSGEYERELGKNYFNMKGHLDFNYVKLSAVEKQARDISTQTAIIKYPFKYKHKQVSWYIEHGCAINWTEWDIYKGSGYYGGMGFESPVLYLKADWTALHDKGIDFDSESSNLKVGLKYGMLAIEYKLNAIKDKPLFQWLLFKVRLK